MYLLYSYVKGHDQIEEISAPNKMKERDNRRTRTIQIQQECFLYFLPFSFQQSMALKKYTLQFLLRFFLIWFLLLNYVSSNLSSTRVTLRYGVQQDPRQRQKQGYLCSTLLLHILLLPIELLVHEFPGIKNRNRKRKKI